METGESFIAAPGRAGRAPGAEDLANVSLRCTAFLLDYILTLLVPAATLVMAVYVKRRWMEPMMANVIVVIGYMATAAVIFFNYVYFYVRRGQSFGKRFVGIRVARVDGLPIDYRTAIMRHIVGYPLSILVLGLGLIWTLWDRNQQGWHDKLAKTVVVND